MEQNKQSKLRRVDYPAYPTADELAAQRAASAPAPVQSFLRSAAADSLGRAERALLDAEASGTPDDIYRANILRDAAANKVQLMPTTGSQTYSEFEQNGDLGNFVGNTLGQAAQSYITPLLSGTVGRGVLGAKFGPLIGAAAGSYDMITAGEANKYAQDPELAALPAQEQQQMIRESALKQTAFEAFGPAFLAGKGRLPGALDRIPAPIKALSNVPLEGATEGAQNYISQDVVQNRFPERETDWTEIRDDAIAGAIGGAGLALIGDYSGVQPRREPVTPGADEPPSPDAPTGEDSPLPPDDTPPPVDEPPPSMRDRFEDWLDRSVEAAATSSNPREFVERMFSAPELDAEADLRPDTETPEVMNAPDPVAAVAEREAATITRAQKYAQQLLDDPEIPEAVKARVQERAQNLEDPASRAFVQRTLVKHRASQRASEAIEAIDNALRVGFGVTKDAVKDLGDAAADRTVKKNLQAVPLTELKPLIDVLAERMGPTGAAKAPELARKLVALSARLDTEWASRQAVESRLRNLDGSVVDDAVLSMVSDLSGSPELNDAIQRLRAIPSALNDVRGSEGSSFFDSMLVSPLSAGQRREAARILDEAAMRFLGNTPEQQNKILAPFVSIFGTPKNARTVLEYYGNLRREQIRKEAESDAVSSRVTDLMRDDEPVLNAPFYDEDGGEAAVVDSDLDANYEDTGVDEGVIASRAVWEDRSGQEEGPSIAYGFRNADQVPFRRFAKIQLSDGKYRAEGRRAIKDAQGKEDMRYSTVGYADYLAEKGVNPEQAVKSMLTYLEKNALKHEARKDKPEATRKAQAGMLRGESMLLQELVKEKGAAAALNELYEVTAREERGDAAFEASDQDIVAMKRGAGKPNTKGMTDSQKKRALEAHEATLVKFVNPNDPSDTLTLSAPQMVRRAGANRGVRRGSEATFQADQDTLLEAISSVMARGYKLVTPVESIKLSADRDARAPFAKWSQERVEAFSKFARQINNDKSVTQTLADLRRELRKFSDALQDKISTSFSSSVSTTLMSMTDVDAEIRDQLDPDIEQMEARVAAAKEVAARAKALAVEARETWFAYKGKDAQKEMLGAAYREAQARADLANMFAREHAETLRDMRSMVNELRYEAESLERTGSTVEDRSGSLDSQQKERRLEAAIGKMHARGKQDTPQAKSLHAALAKEREDQVARERDAKYGRLAEETPPALREGANTLHLPSSKVDAPISSARLDAIIAANPELRTVLDSSGAPLSPSSVFVKKLDSATRERLVKAYAKLPITVLKTRLESLRGQYKQSVARGPKFEQEQKAIKYIGEMLKHIIETRSGTPKASSQRPGSTGPRVPTQAEKNEVLAEIERLRGPRVKVLINKLHAQLGGSGQYTYTPGDGRRVIEIAVDAMSLIDTARHEAMHDFFAMLNRNSAFRSVKRDLENAANAPHIVRRLEGLLKDHPEALQQIKKDPEERVAYMYQFWAAGELTLGPDTQNIFERIKRFIRDIFKLATENQRAEDLLNAFHAGKFSKPAVVTEVLTDLSTARDTTRNRLERAAPKLTAAIRKVFETAPDRLRDFHNEKLNELADMFSPEVGIGFVQRRARAGGVWTNRLAKILDGTTAVERRTAIDNLQAQKSPSSELERNIASYLDDMHTYLHSSGVMNRNNKGEWKPIHKVKGYFPRHWDRSRILANKAVFIQLLRQHGNMNAANAEDIVRALTHGTGQYDLAESEHHLGYTPYMEASQARKLNFINPSNAEAFAEFMSKDLTDTLMSYTYQAVHRAEYARMFGNDGEVIQAKIAQANLSSEEAQEAFKITRALEGSLDPGYWSADTKELASSIMTLQNLVLLPLAIFSQMIDPVIMAARSGNLQDIGNGYMTAIKKLVGSENVDGEDLADMLGIIQRESVLEAMGAAYGSTHMSRNMRHINRVFFKWNGLQGWNNSMRIAATAAGEKYLIANRDDTQVLDELGLEPSDIVTKEVDGSLRLDVTNDKVKEALFQFVDQAVIRPSSTNRPVWMSDPRFQLVGHLKQFTFAMHNVVLKRANQQMDRYDNPMPWATLALAMPVVLIADMTKFALTGNLPTNWGFMDYMSHAVERSGLLGLADFGVQFQKSVEHGGAPGEMLGGPAFEHLMALLRFLTGDANTDLGEVVDRTVPGARFL